MTVKSLNHFGYKRLILCYLFSIIIIHNILFIHWEFLVNFINCIRDPFIPNKKGSKSKSFLYYRRNFQWQWNCSQITVSQVSQVRRSLIYKFASRNPILLAFVEYNKYFFFTSVTLKYYQIFLYDCIVKYVFHTKK